MSVDATISPGKKTPCADRFLLVLEVLIFALPCYLIYLACLPWAMLAVGIIPSAIGEIVSDTGEPYDADHGTVEG